MSLCFLFTEIVASHVGSQQWRRRVTRSLVNNSAEDRLDRPHTEHCPEIRSATSSGRQDTADLSTLRAIPIAFFEAVRIAVFLSRRPLSLHNTIVLEEHINLFDLIQALQPREPINGPIRVKRKMPVSV